MAGLDDLRVFERVGSLRSFSAAASELSQPKSSISRSIARLEQALGMRLFQRTTREVSLTEAGTALIDRCASALGELSDAMDHVGKFAAEPRGMLRLSAGIGFGVNVLGELLPIFAARYPKVDISLDMTSRAAELVSDRVDVAIRMGPQADSTMVTIRLGEMRRLLCAAPAYLDRAGTPQTLEDLIDHDVVEMPGIDGRVRVWNFAQAGHSREVHLTPRICVNDALTIHRLVLNGAGVGVISCYIAAPEIEAGRLTQLSPDWEASAVLVSLVFPSRRELAPAVRAFVDFMKEENRPGRNWRNNTLAVRGA